jgi:glycosyltransferase involved in cell wall biosynthesis
MRVIITMPAYNEEGICDFINELNIELSEHILKFIVVDDNSTSTMESELISLQREKNVDIGIINNFSNFGHGPSTLIGLKRSLDFTPDVVIAVDGDGQFLSREIASCLKKFTTLPTQKDIEIVEGCRTQRSDPSYRKISTLAARLLIRSVCGKSPQDANTPLRFYKPQVLLEILNNTPTNLLTPNLFISGFCRLKNYEILELEVTSIPRRGTSKVGTTWKQRTNGIPSRRFLTFCMKAISQWFKIIAPRLKKEVSVDGV